MVKKKNIFVFCIILVVVVIGVYFLISKLFNNEKGEITVVDKITSYNYSLESNESNFYKRKFKELKTLLLKEEKNDSKYAELVATLFVSDFYHLDNKITNQDIGGIQFIHSSIVDNFSLKAKDTIYKYVESNVYNDRRQLLPVVEEVIIKNVESKRFSKEDIDDLTAFYVLVEIIYKKDLGYPNEVTLVLVHEGEKLSIIEVN